MTGEYVWNLVNHDEEEDDGLYEHLLSYMEDVQQKLVPVDFNIKQKMAHYGRYCLLLRNLWVCPDL
jgi:hypothetical protein